MENNKDKLEYLLHVGANMAQLCDIFKMDARDIKAKLAGNVLPSSKNGKSDVYSIREVSPYLVPPPYDMEEFISKMKISDLPTQVQKEYWAGMRSRQLFEKEQAELWSTEEVQTVIADIFKTLRMSLLLTRESVERETDLTTRQRDIIKAIIKNALEDLYAKTNELCADGKRNSTENVRPETDVREETL